MNLLLGVALVLGLMIMIHEWGHFIVARFLGVRVDVFSIGFGPRLFGWKRGATDYRVSALPFGGYVRMAGQDLSEVDSNDVAPTGAPDELMSKPRWQRALISFAGPAVNLIFPILLLTALFVAVGLPYSSFYDLPVQVVALPADKVGQVSPLQVGDKLVSINGIRNPTWEQAQKAFKQTAPGEPLKLEVDNAGTKRNVELTLNAGMTLERILGYPPLPPILDEVAPGTPAERSAPCFLLGWRSRCFRDDRRAHPGDHRSSGKTLQRACFRQAASGRGRDFARGWRSRPKGTAGGDFADGSDQCEPGHPDPPAHPYP